jgi:hypothetical protein
MNCPSWRIRLTAQERESVQTAFFARYDGERSPKTAECSHVPANGLQTALFGQTLAQICQKCGEVMP